MFYSLLFKFKEWIMGAGVILASVLYIYLKGKSDGEKGANDKANKALERDKKSAKDIRDNVDSMSPSELDKRLSDWTRKG